MYFNQIGFYDIISTMRKRLLHILPVMLCVLSGAAHANWQYPGTYVGDGWYADDGSRFVISVRGGASYSFASIKNEIGSMTAEYFYNPADGMVVSGAWYDACVDSGQCEGFEYAGIGDLAALPAKEDYSSFSFAAGASIGWTIPNRPQWRIEAGWDHISETEYNVSPLFDGDITLTSGMILNAQSGSVQSKISTDIISAMAFYDFFDGFKKPVNKMIPYIGFGVGYADTKTTLNLSDLYGDLSTSVDLQQFGELDDYKVLQFYRSETSTSNIAGLLALGFSYGITDTLFMDLGARVMYIPKIKWALTNADDTRHRDWFSGENLIYTNVMLGLRFEF